MQGRIEFELLFSFFFLLLLEDRWQSGLSFCRCFKGYGESGINVVFIRCIGIGQGWMFLSEQCLCGVDCMIRIIVGAYMYIHMIDELT